MLKKYYLDWAKTIYQEIEEDSDSSWFKPKGPVTGGDGPGDFDYGQMRFVNKNLNYFYYDNMISHALKNEYDYNPKYKKTLEFCDFVRTITGETGPYGRMCIWKLEPKCYLLPHVDNWSYHRNITRYIFCISDLTTPQVKIVIKDEHIDVVPGLLFNFHPDCERHEFVNNSEKNFYFLGFDYWDPKKLTIASMFKNINKDTVVDYQEGYGGFRKRTKYMSPE